jgi:hypothetical protein
MFRVVFLKHLKMCHWPLHHRTQRVLVHYLSTTTSVFALPSLLLRRNAQKPKVPFHREPTQKICALMIGEHRELSTGIRYSIASPKSVKLQNNAGGVSASANSQALIDAAAAREAELAMRVAQSDLTQQHAARAVELQAMVDGFIAADRQFLQLPGGTRYTAPCPCCWFSRYELGMAAWERGFIHDYAGTKGLHHPTTEACARDFFSAWCCGFYVRGALLCPP